MVDKLHKITHQMLNGRASICLPPKNYILASSPALHQTNKKPVLEFLNVITVFSLCKKPTYSRKHPLKY